MDISFENYKQRILQKASDVDVLSEIGYCYKRACLDEFSPASYWSKCYYFLKGLAHYRGISPI
jgi:DNA-directed RNA polymerase subunit N (RpoN/RPB10)